MGVLRRELSALHNAFSQGKSSFAGACAPVCRLGAGMAAVRASGRNAGASDRLAGSRTLGKERLLLLELPTDRPRPSAQTFQGASKQLQLSEPLSESLKNLGQREGATLFMTLLAAFQVLLYRYSGQDNIVVGTPIANRTQSQTELNRLFSLTRSHCATDLRGIRALLSYCTGSGRVR